MYALFDQKKEFIGFSENFPDIYGSGIIKIKVPDEYADPTKFMWKGTLDNGAFFELNEFLNLKDKKEKFEIILNKYPLEIQLINIIKQLNTLSEKQNIFDLNFKQMATDILNIWK